MAETNPRCETASASDWAGFHERAAMRPARELLRRALGAFEIEGRPPGIAVDLGSGSGPDAVELLRRGWVVHAVDESEGGLAMLTQAAPPEVRPRLTTHARRFEDFVFPRCDLVWSSWSLPYCPRERWPDLWSRIAAALAPGGRFAADLFGVRHAWASMPEVLTFDEDDLRRQLQRDLVLEAFDIEEGVRPSAGELTRWHAFGVVARRRLLLPLAGEGGG